MASWRHGAVAYHQIDIDRLARRRLCRKLIGLGVDLSSPEIDRDYMGLLHGTMILFEDSLDDHVSAGTGKLD
jgi:hypothetical protein